MDFTKATKSKDIKRNWHLINLEDKILGRISTQIAGLLIGKTKPYYIPSLDCGDHVIVINARKVKVTGKKATFKTYDKYSGYPGGLKRKYFRDVIAENPQRIIKESVSGMLPKNKLRDLMLKRLYIFADDNYPYGDKIKSQNAKVKITN